MDPITRLGSFTTLWRLTCQQDGTVAPNGLVTMELRALSEAAALDQLHCWRPDLRVLQVERQPTPHTFPVTG